MRFLEFTKIAAIVLGTGLAGCGPQQPKSGYEPEPGQGVSPVRYASFGRIDSAVMRRPGERSLYTVSTRTGRPGSEVDMRRALLKTYGCLRIDLLWVAPKQNAAEYKGVRCTR